MERYRTAIRLVMRVAVFCLPIGPIALVIYLTGMAIESGSLRDALSEIRPAQAIFGCLKLSALTLPTIATLAVAMTLLGKLRRDSFPVAFGIGTILVGAGIGITTWIMAGPWSDIDFDDPYTRYEAAIFVVIVLAVGALLSALYWLLAVRRDRRLRLRAESDTHAIRAME